MPYAEYNGAGFKDKYWSQTELWPFLYTQVDWVVFRKYVIKFSIKLHISEQLTAPIAIFHLQMYITH